MYGFRRMVTFGVFGFALILCFVATPTLAATPSLVVDGGSNTITSLNQTAIVVSGNSGFDGIGSTFNSGTSTVTLVDSVGTTLTGEKVFTSLDSKTYSLSFDTTSLVDGSVTVSLETIATQGNTLASLSVAVVKQTIASTPEFAFFLLPSATDSTECVSRSAEFLSYSSTTPTNKGVCALLSTTTTEVFSSINTNAHLFTINDSFVFTFNDSLGNTGASTVTVANIDISAPIISITTPENATTTGQTLTPSVFATDSNTVTLGCVLDGVSLTDCTSLIGGLAGGNHMFTVNALDSAGNTSASSSVFMVAFANPLLSFVATSTLALEPIDQTATTTLSVASGVGTTTIAIPIGTSITRSDVATLSAADISLTHIDGSTFLNIATGVVVDGALQWGIPTVGLEFSKPVTVSMYVGAALNGTTLTIYRSLALTSGWTQDGLVSSTCIVANGLCSFQTTKASYFTSVHVPAPAPAPAPSGGGGGGGGGGIIGGVSVSILNTNSSSVSTPIAVIATPIETVPVLESVGSILGASTYNFTRTLTVGSKGEDVKALQERLRDEGLYSGPITSYFGALTGKAVKTYQGKNALPAVGIVGPMTREVLNKGVAQKTPTVSTQTLSDAQVSAILELLQSFGADATIIANVSASLGKSLP